MFECKIDAKDILDIFIRDYMTTNDVNYKKAYNALCNDVHSLQHGAGTTLQSIQEEIIKEIAKHHGWHVINDMIYDLYEENY